MLRSGRLSLGPTIDRFEELIAERDRRAVRRGRLERHCRPAPARAASPAWGPGDEAITSPISFAASANCFIFEGATPVFADVDPRTLNLDPPLSRRRSPSARRRSSRSTCSATPASSTRSGRSAERHGLALIEDAAEALGAEYKGAPIGSHGPSGVFGFYPNKQLATGEGGVVFTHYERGVAARPQPPNQGRDYEGGAWFHHVRLGWNYRWTDVQAAIGIGQLEKLDRLLELRSAAAGATASCWRASTSSRSAPTTPTTSARGSSTWWRCRGRRPRRA